MGTSAYLPPDDGKPVRKRTSIRLEPRELTNLHLLADVWNALDASRKVKRRTKWKAHSVVERIVRVSLDEFFIQVGGPPREGESSAEFIKRAANELGRPNKK